MPKKIFIGENDLLKIKNAMAGNNISHSNSIVESTELDKEDIDYILKNKPNRFVRWAVADKHHVQYFEKKSYAIDCKKSLNRLGCNTIIIDVDKYNITENDVPPYEADEFEIGGEGGNNDFFHIEKAKVNENTFEKWFGNSVLKDENGNPIKMYHGTDAQFDAFSKDFIGSTGAFEGYGFNFTPYYSSAAHYNSKNVIEAYLRVENPMTTKTNNITLRTLIGVIKELDKGKDYTETVVAAYETPRYGEKWDERYYRRALPIAAKKIYEYNKENGYGDAGIYAEISLNGQADAKDVIRVFEGLGYDAAIHYDNYDKMQTVVVFEPNQIKLVTNKTYNNDSEIMSENKLDEHHRDQRLPFKEPEFSRKRYIEQYTDWLEEFGRYGELPNGTLDFWEEIAKAVETIKDGELHGRFDTSLPYNKTNEEIVEQLKNEIIGPDLMLDNGKVYIERAVDIKENPRKYERGFSFDDNLYNQLIKDYNDNVGGCWCYKDAGSSSYCSSGFYTIKLYGCIRTDDIDFIKTVQLNFHYSDEHEIRVKPFAKIELEGICYGGTNGYVSFDKHLIVSATYSGNNAKYNGEFGKIDDGFGNTTVIDRDRNIINKNTINGILEKYLAGKDISKLASNGPENRYNIQIAKSYGAGLYVIYVNRIDEFDKNQYNFYSSVDNKILLDNWINDFGSDYYGNGLVLVSRIYGLKTKYNFFNLYKKRIASDEWFYYAETPSENGISVIKNEDGTSDYFNVFNEKRLTNQHFEYAQPFESSYKTAAYKNSMRYIINQNGNVSLDNEYYITENIESEVESSEVKLDSFKKRDTLAPKIWDGFDLNPKVRLKLLDIADDFWEFVNLSWVKRKGIYLTGSICNFNWSKHSDIDMHIVVDFSDVDDREDFVQDYFNSKKNEWNSEHSNLKIYGFQVELYVENVNAETESGGIYDLEDNSWVKKPNSDNIKPIGLDKYPIKDKSAELMTKVDDLYDKFKVTDDDAELRAIGNEASDILDDIKKMRKVGLKRGGESDQFNIVYKVLRRAGYIDKLWNLKSSLYDKLNSITEINEGVLLEYLEKEHSATLYDYFRWANSASNGEKALDILDKCPETTMKYVGRMSKDYPEFNEIYQQSRIDRNVMNNEKYTNLFAKAFDNDEFLLRGLIRFCGFNADGPKLPTWTLMKFNRVVKNEWCIHFCYDADSIVRDGFKWGTSDMHHLALTGAGAKKESVGYDFAFPIGEEHIDTNGYGSFNPETQQIKRNREAVIFQVSGVEVFHKGDKQNQVIFWGPNAKNFIPIKFDGRKWRLYGADGQVLYSGTPSSILNWVLNNLPQYRNQIMFGKNGRSLKEEVVADGNASHNPFKQKWKHEREVLKNYLVNYGEIMTSKENGKEYKVLYDTMLSSRLGISYCICIQWNTMEMRPGNVIYVRAFDKFTRRRFTPQFDTRGFDNIEGTADDLA